MTGVILYRLKYSGDPSGIPISGIAYYEVGQDPEDQTWCLEITTTDGSCFIIGRGTKDYCEKKFRVLTSAISENRDIDVTEW